MQINDLRSASAFVDNVARMAVHAGKTVNEGAGKGFVGILNGMVVKVGTHWTERSAAGKSEDMQRACGELRSSLMAAAEKIASRGGLGPSEGQKTALAAIRAELGLFEGGAVALEGQQRLITREVALSVVKKIRELDADGTLGATLDSVKGEATIKDSKIDKSLTVTVQLQELKDTFLGTPAKVLVESLYPGDTPETEQFRGQILKRMGDELIFRNGGLSVGNIRLTDDKGKLDLHALDNGKVQNAPTMNVAVNWLCRHYEGRSALSEPNYQKALAKIFLEIADVQVVVDKSGKTHYGDELGSFVRRPILNPAATFEPIALPPSTGDKFERTWTRVKNLALASVGCKASGGENVYLNFQGWLLDQAAKAANTTIKDLTVENLVKYAKDHWKQTPEKISGGVMSAGWGRLTVGRVMSQLGLDENDKDSDIKEWKKSEESAAYLAMVFLNADTKLGDDDVKLADAVTLYAFGGGLNSPVSETKTYKMGAAEATVKSNITPSKARTSCPVQDQSLSNLATTELRGEDDRPLFRGLRFGQICQEKTGGSVKDQITRYGELVKEAFLSRMSTDEVLAKVQNGQTEFDVPLCRVDMAGETNLRHYAPNYEITVGGKRITLKPKVMHFRIPTDSVALVPVTGGDGTSRKEWRLLAKEDVARTDQALKTILAYADSKQDSLSPFDKALVRQVREFWTKVTQPPLKDGDGNLALFANAGAYMMQFGARLAVLADHLGIVPAINCSGGRDRTGLMDVECKTLALFQELNPGAEPPEISDDQVDGYRKLRKDVRSYGGNQQVARMILLNEKDMYVHQVESSLNKKGPDDPGLPTQILAFYSENEESKVDYPLAKEKGKTVHTQGIEEVLY